jgi:beta-galactosidase
MYAKPAWCVDHANNDPSKRPVILCEYAHMMGNSGGCLSTYWKHFLDPEQPRMQGGFIWDLIDQGLVLRDEGHQHTTAAPASSQVDRSLEMLRYGYGGDFGDHPNSIQFCCNGLLGPDRSPHPSAYEAAAWQSPIQVDLRLSHHASQEKLTLQIKNYRRFLDTDDLEILFAVASNLSVQQPSGTTTLNYVALPRSLSVRWMEEKSFALESLFSIFSNHEHHDAAAVSPNDPTFQKLCEVFSTKVDMLSSLSEVWIEVIVRTRVATAWLPAGHHLLRRSLRHPSILPFIRRKYAIPRASLALALSKHRLGKANSVQMQVIGRDCINFSWESGACASISLATGLLTSWTLHGSNYLLEALSPSLYRAATDNDIGGWIFSYESQWEAVGLRYLQTKSSSVEYTSSSGSESDGSIRVIVRLILHPKTKVAVPLDFPTEIHYRFYPDGGIYLSASIAIPANSPPLPRCGLQFALPSTMSQVAWFGLGPHEAYEDRKQTVYLGKFMKAVSELHTPYVYPQECGRRADPRWITFYESSSSRRLMVIPNADHVADSDEDSESSEPRGWGFNASYFSMDEYADRLHDYELMPSSDHRVYVHVDSKMMGVGGYDSWTPNVDPDYLIQGRSITTSIILKLLDHGESKSEYYNAVKAGKYHQ